MPTLITAGDLVNGTVINTATDGALTIQTGPNGSKVNALAMESAGRMVVGTAASNTPLTDNDLSFDLNARNNFSCTPSALGTLTFTNIASASGQSGFVLLVNGANHAISAAATTKITATDLSRISSTGTYLISYFSNGTNVFCSASGNVA
jgi:hypothetical protein